MKIIPAIDILDGKCVRLSKGDYDTSKIYNENPLELAKQFEAHGIEFLHLVDLDGAKSGTIINHKVLHEIASGTNLTIDFGGGIKTRKDVLIAFENGAAKITGGTMAVKNRPLFEECLEVFGADKIILGADQSNGKIAVSGWLEDSREEAILFIRDYFSKGIRQVISTDISKDGMLEGPNFKWYTEILTEIEGIKLIASGGIATLDDVVRLSEIGCYGTIIGKAIYENRISLKALENYILANTN